MRVLGRASAASLIDVVLGFVRFGIAIGLMIAAVATLLIPFASSSVYSVTVPASFTVDGLAPLHGGRPGFGFEVGRSTDGTEPEHAPDNAARKRALFDRVDGSVTIDDASKAFVAANAVALIVIMIYALFILDQVRAVLKTLIHDNPFDPANGTHIRRVGLAVIAGELARAMLVWAENIYAAGHVAIDGVRFVTSPDISFRTLIYGLIILVIAEVFRAGTRLDQEQSLTI
jgi:hypothetical protein